MKRPFPDPHFDTQMYPVGSHFGCHPPADQPSLKNPAAEFDADRWQLLQNQFMAAVPSSTNIGNKALRELLAGIDDIWTKDVYTQIKKECVELGLLRVRRGQGGSICRVNTIESEFENASPTSTFSEKSEEINKVTSVDRTNQALMLELGAEGGSISFYWNQDHVSPKYWALEDSSFELSEEDGGTISTHREGDAKDNWIDAITGGAGKHWFNLTPLHVDPNFRKNVLREVLAAAGVYSSGGWINACFEHDKDQQKQIALARKVLLMVEELHRMGYQELRIFPSLTNNMFPWICKIYPSSSSSSLDKEWPCYSTSDEDKYFGWSSLHELTPQDMALLFLRTFPTHCKFGKRSDWAYAGWFQEMVRVTSPGHLPFVAEVNDDQVEIMNSWNGGKNEWIPTPPPPCLAGC